MKKGFTLAEVLITLGIIGVVAAITMPVLVSRFKEKETVTKLKKVSSVISSAYMQIVADKGTIDTWGLLQSSSPATANALFENFRPYLNIIKDCGVGKEGCFPNVKYKKFDDSDSINFVTNAGKRYMVVLSDGSLLAFFPASLTEWRTSDMAVVYIDVNGVKPPNKFGVDTFQFSISKASNYAVPAGTNESLQSCYSTGYDCAAWVIYNENMDYLHCDDLSWDGKKKCGN